jgi:hypothetical protein
MLENAKEIAPCILLLDNAIEKPKEIIKMALKKSKKDGFLNAEVIDKSNNNVVQKEVRDTSMIPIAPTFDNDVFWWHLAKKLWNYGDAYGKKYNISFSQMEPSQFLFYQKGSGFYNSHSDSAPYRPRIFSLILYLNNVDIGGETHFEYFNLSVKPVAGRLLMFPSDFAYFHGAKIPVSDNKNVVVTWFNP